MFCYSHSTYLTTVEGRAQQDGKLIIEKQFPSRYNKTNLNNTIILTFVLVYYKWPTREMAYFRTQYISASFFFFFNYMFCLISKHLNIAPSNKATTLLYTPKMYN